MQRKDQEPPHSLWHTLSPSKVHPWSLRPCFPFDKFNPFPLFNQERVQKGEANRNFLRPGSHPFPFPGLLGLLSFLIPPWEEQEPAGVRL